MPFQEWICFIKIIRLSLIRQQYLYVCEHIFEDELRKVSFQVSTTRQSSPSDFDGKEYV